MTKKAIEQIIIDEFSFLKNDCGFRLMNTVKESWGLELEFVNSTTGIILNYEFREAYLQVFIYKLVDGKIIKNPRCINDATRLTGFCLDDILSLKNPRVIVKPAYEYGEQSEYFTTNNGMTTYIKKFAENLRDYASDLFKGDFSIFPELEKIVKKRAQEYRQKNPRSKTK